MQVLILREREEMANQPIEASGEKHWMGLGHANRGGPSGFHEQNRKRKRGKEHSCV